MSLRRQRLDLAFGLLAALYGLAFSAPGKGSADEPKGDSAPLHLEIDLAAARSRQLEFVRVVVDGMSDWLYPSVIPENSAYCLEPDVIGDRCLVPPHTLVLQLSLGNLTWDRILDASFSLDAPELALLESRGPRYVPGDGWFLPFAELRYDPDVPAAGPHHIEIGLLEPSETRRVYLLVAFPEPPAAPDRLSLEFLAEAVEVPVEEEELLTRITFERDRALTVPPRDGAPGVQLSSYNVDRDGTLEIFEVAAPGLLADLPPDLRIAEALVLLGRLSQKQGEYRQAGAHYTECLSIVSGRDDEPFRVAAKHCLVGLGESTCAQGRFRESFHHFHEAVRRAHGADDVGMGIRSLVGIADALVGLGEGGKALALLAFTLAQPDIEGGTRERAERLYTGLTTQRSEPAVAAAQGQARALRVQKITGLLSDWQQQIER